MKLSEYIAEALATDYKEGEFDCGIFVARWADLRSGSRVAESIAGTYSTKLEMLRKYGPTTGPTNAATVLEVFVKNCRWTQTDDYTTGDIVTLTNGDVGIAWNDGAVKLLTGRMVGLVGPDQIRQAWTWKGGAE